MTRMLCLILAVLFPASVVAKSPTYICTMKSTGTGGWIPKKIVFLYDEEHSFGVVVDSISHAVTKEASRSTFRRRGPDRVELRWSPGKGVPTTVRGIRAGVIYIMNFRPSKGRVNVVAQVRPGDRRAQSNGTCTKEG